MFNSWHSRSRAPSMDERSLYSNAASTRYMLADVVGSSSTPYTSSSSEHDRPPVSLSVNYLPNKFSNTSPLTGKRSKKDGKNVFWPKRGGGIEAFRSGESRMPGEHDEDYDGVQAAWFRNKKNSRAPPKMRWNKFKWALLVGNSFLTIYSLVAFIFCLCTWCNIWDHADVVRVGNRPELAASTLASILGIVTCVIGWSGILLNNRSFLAVYTFLLWIVFIFLVAPGYVTYKRRSLNLEGKVNAQWSRGLGPLGRLRIQDSLGCCGYFSPFVEATISQTCYARSILPGCKKRYLDFERVVLRRWYKTAFSIVPFHIGIIFVGLLCSNHVTYRFGKGMMPKAYRLSMNSMAVIMDNYAAQLAEEYGLEMASEILARSRSNLELDKTNTFGVSNPKYDRLHSRDQFPRDTD